MNNVVLVAVVVLCSTAHADAPARSIVAHRPPLASPAGEPIQLAAMIDSPFAETLGVRYRDVGSQAWHEVAFERSSAGGWYASLPAAAPPGVEYYIRGRDAGGAEVAHFASASAPHVVRVDPSLTDRLAAQDRARLGGRANQISLDVIAHDFGNRYAIPDRFLRGELAYTHRLWRALHQLTFGFGSIEGKTPRESMPDGRVLSNALRYGFAEARVRAHRSVFVDLRLSLGASHAGFDQGARGVVTFGKPWRSNLSIGGEVLGDLGPSAWVRLQWDTAPPLLMGASVVRTDLPGAVIDSAGLYLGYDVAYPIAERFTVRAQLSYGSRDGASHFGGGLGTALDF